MIQVAPKKREDSHRWPMPSVGMVYLRTNLPYKSIIHGSVNIPFVPWILIWECHPPTDDEVLHAGNNLNPQRNQAIGLRKMVYELLVSDEKLVY